VQIFEQKYSSYPFQSLDQGLTAKTFEYR